MKKIYLFLALALAALFTFAQSREDMLRVLRSNQNYTLVKLLEDLSARGDTAQYRTDSLLQVINTVDGRVTNLEAFRDTLFSGYTTVRVLAGVVRPYMTTVGSPIEWQFLSSANGDGSHEVIGFDSITALQSVLSLYFRSTHRVVMGIAVLDDQLSSRFISVGTGVGLSNLDINFSILKQFGGLLYNNGTTWNLATGTNATVSYNSTTGILDIQDIPYRVPAYTFTANYVSLNSSPAAFHPYAVRYHHNALANGECKLQLFNTTSGAAVTGTPDPDDALYVTGDLYTTSLVVDTLNDENKYVFDTLANIWVLAILLD